MYSIGKFGIFDHIPKLTTGLHWHAFARFWRVGQWKQSHQCPRWHTRRKTSLRMCCHRLWPQFQHDNPRGLGVCEFHVVFWSIFCSGLQFLNTMYQFHFSDLRWTKLTPICNETFPCPTTDRWGHLAVYTPDHGFVSQDHHNLLTLLNLFRQVCFVTWFLILSILFFLGNPWWIQCRLWSPRCLGLQPCRKCVDSITQHDWSASISCRMLRFQNKFDLHSRR